MVETVLYCNVVQIESDILISCTYYHPIKLSYILPWHILKKFAIFKELVNSA